MAHDIRINGERFALVSFVDVGCEERALLRVQRTEQGDAIVFARGEMMRDGVPVLGNLTIVAWGESTLLRVARKRVELVWREIEERRVPPANACCRLCFGPFAAGETAIVCRCTCSFHQDCDRVRSDCPACGAPRGQGAT